MTAPLTVRTPRLLLRPLTATDRDEFVRVAEVSRGHFAPWTPAVEPGVRPEDQFQRELERTMQGDRDGTACRRTIVVVDLAIASRAQQRVLTPDGLPIAGMVGLNNIVRGVFLNGDMGWRISVEFTRLGLGAEAVTAMLDLAFAPLGRGLALHRVQANVIPTNIPSLRLAERVGFRREGEARRMLCIAGKWQDHIMFAKLAEEHALVYLR